MTNTPSSSTDEGDLPDAPPADTPPSGEEVSQPVAIKDEPAPSSPPAPFSAKTEDTKHKDVKDLDTIFDDDDDDDLIGGINEADLLAAEIPDKKPVVVAARSGGGGGGSGGPAVDSNVQLAFYQRLFPWRTLFQWLNHSPTPCNDFGHREFAFTIESGREPIYIRYQSFPTSDLMRKRVVQLNPSRFEIGPIYSANPRDRKSLRKAAFHPIEKELVFDIDMTDYDDVRTCCDKANICHKCWNFITVSIKILDTALREDFGFEHIMWVYSGRRGAHAWVCDKRARVLDDTRRRAVASYLEIVKGGRLSQLKRPLSPHVARSLAILSKTFAKDILRDQDPWRETEASERLLKLLPDAPLNAALRKKWASAEGRSSFDKWSDIGALAKEGVSRTLDTRKLLEAKQDITFQYFYPRLDVAVSKQRHHLLKSPFVVHPGTGRVCVPIDHNDPESFDPLAVPTAVELLKEIDAWGMKNPAVKMESTPEEISIQDYEKTSLKPWVDFFRKFVAGLLKDETAQKEKVKREADEMDF